MIPRKPWFGFLVCLTFALVQPAAGNPLPKEQPDAAKEETPSRTDAYGDPLPPGAIARLGTVRLRTILRDGSGEANLALSPDGKILASAGDVGVCLWDTATGKKLNWDRTKPTNQIVAFSADGKEFITANSSGLIQFWQAGTSKLLREASLDINGANKSRPTHGYTILSRDASKLVYIDDMGQRTVQVWDVASGKKVFQTEHKGPPLSVALSPNNKVLVVGGWEVLARLFDVATGKEIRRLEWPGKPPPIKRNGLLFVHDPLYLLTFSPNGTKLASTSQKAIEVWDVATGKLDYQIKASRGRTAFSPDGKYLASGDRDAIRLYDADTGKLLRCFDKHSSYDLALLFSADGQTIASAEDYLLTLWDTKTGKRKLAFPGHQGIVHCVAFSPDGKRLASGGNIMDLQLILWNLTTQKPQHSVDFDIDVLSVVFSPDGQTLAVGDGVMGTGGTEAWLYFYQGATGKLLREFPAHINSVQRLAFSPDGKRLLTSGNDARVKVWDVATGKRQSQIRGQGSARFALSPDGKYLAISWGGGGALGLWDAKTGQKIRDLGSSTGVVRSIFFLAFLPDGKTLLSREQSRGVRGGRDVNQVHFWKSETGQLLRSIPIAVPEEWDPCYALSPDGKLFAAPAEANWRKGEGGIRLWDTTSGELLAHLKGHAGAVTALAFSWDGKLLASGSRDTTILVWDMSKVRLLVLGDKLAAATGGITSRIVKKLAETPEEVMPMLQERLRRVADVEARAIPLIADLQSDNFKVRQQATQELEKLGPGAELTLRLALEGKPSPEVSKRIQTLLDKIKSKAEDSTGLFNSQNALLALEMLEEIGSPQARKVLQELAKGRPEGRLAREAAAALKRLQKRGQAPGRMP
jgi:WD40 repeat protein